MVRQYTERFYVPAIRLTHKLTDDDLAAARALTAWKDRVREAWHAVAIEDIKLESTRRARRRRADERLGTCAPGRRWPPTTSRWSCTTGLPHGAHEIDSGESCA